MQKSTKKRLRNGIAWLVAVLFFGTLIYLHWIQNYWKFDRTFVDQIDRYEVIHKKLTHADLKPLRVQFDDHYSVFPHTGVNHDFTLEFNKADTAKNDYLKRFYPEVYTLLATGKLKAIHILSKKEILFQLKWCNNASCFKDVKRFTGFYTHYLSKNAIDFKTLAHTKLIEKKQFGEWWYYIVWSAKG